MTMMLALAASATDPTPELNIYASGLRVSQENGVTKVSYMLNAPASSLNVKLYADDEYEELIATIPITGSSNLTKGSHTNVVIDLTSVAIASGEYYWTMEASASANNSIKTIKADTDDEYTLPRGLDVDKNTQSPSFGNIYIADAYGYTASGLVAFYPPTFNSRTTFTTSGWTASPASPMRVTVGADDYLLYICDWSDNTPNVYIVDPQNPTGEMTSVFGGTKSGVYGIYVNGLSQEIHGSISHCYVTGSENTRIIYTFDEDYTGGNGRAFRLLKYEINTIPYTSAPTTIFPNTANLEQNGNTQIWPDGKDGWWISQNRDNDTEEIPMLIHLAGSDKSVNFNSKTSGLNFGVKNRGALGLNNDLTQLATGCENEIKVWNISWSEETPTLELAYSIATDKGCTFNVSFDYAGNIYAAFDGDYLYAYAPVKENNMCETPAKVEDNDKIVVSNPHICAYGLNVEATGTGYRFSFTTNMAAASGYIAFYDADTNDSIGKVNIDKIVKGDNIVTIPITSLPGDFGQEMTWKVRLTGGNNTDFSLIYKAEELTADRGGFVAVDASPESDYFGRIYYFNRRVGENVTSSGLYYYSQDYKTRSSLIRFGESGNIGIMHMSVDEDGKIWGIDFTDAHSGVWIITPGDSPANYSYSQLFQGNRDGDGLITNGSKEVGGSGTGLFLYTNGDNKTLYTTQEDFSNTSGYPMAVYSVNDETTWGDAPTILKINNANGHNSIYVVQQGIWISQWRFKGQNTEVNPALQFYAENGNLKKSFHTQTQIDGCMGSGMTIDEKNNKLYMVDASQNIMEFNISYDASNVPSLEFVAKHNIGYDYVTSMCMDYAGNLIVAAGDYYPISGTGGPMRMMIFSPATDNNTTLVPAKSDKTVTKVSHSREVDQVDDWGTVCLPYGVTTANRSGATFYSIAGKRTNNNELTGTPVSVVLSEVEGNLEKGKPYIFQSTAENIYLLYTDEEAAVAAGSDNGLIGKFERFPFEGNISSENIENTYILTTSRIQRASMKSGIIAYRAYIDMSQVGMYSPGQQAPGRILEIPLAPQSPTDVDAANADNTIRKFVKNGQVYILRDGKSYDVLGQILK